MKQTLRIVCAALLAAAPASAQRARPSYDVIDYDLESGLFSGADAPRQATYDVIQVPDAVWIRVELRDARLGRGSTLRVTSLADGDQQVFDAGDLEHWELGTALFNGDAVELELFVAPGDPGAFFEVERVLAGRVPEDPAESLCGSDDRIASSNNRVGRLPLVGCTGWRVTSGFFLTAGHCADFDLDDCGAMVPDGVLDLAGCLEFNIPASSSSGVINMAAAADQFPVNTSTVEWRFDGSCMGLGKDWAIFEVGPNTLGQLPHERYGLPYRISRESPAGAGPARITGCGIDESPPGTTGSRNTDSQTLQTNAGPYLGESSSGTDIWHEYQADTRGGSSGSPILWQLHGVAIGIHTNGGCSAAAGNTGTSFEVNQLESRMQHFFASETRFVDAGHPLPVTETGQIYRPFDTVAEAVNDLPAGGGLVSVVEGSYPAAGGDAFTTTKAVTIVAPVGTVTIGH